VAITAQGCAERMVVCSCRAVTDGVICAAIEAGATTVDEVTAYCAAASRCRGCSPELERLIATYARRIVPVTAAVA